MMIHCDGILESLRCPACGDTFEVEVWIREGDSIVEGQLRSSCGRRFPIIGGVARILPANLDAVLLREYPDFFKRHHELKAAFAFDAISAHGRTLTAFGDEWRRFPMLEEVHESIFRWYFEGPNKLSWEGLEVLDAGCGMGRWLHFARREGARVIGMDVSTAIDVAYFREGPAADLLQADLLWPPFAPGSFDMVYSLGVVHHLDDPAAGVRSLASLVRHGGELRMYVYRSLEGDAWWRRALLAIVTALRRVTIRLPFVHVHAIALAIAAFASVFFLLPRRILRRVSWGERMTRHIPLVHYAGVPFRMLVAEQFDRFVAPIEKRYKREEIEQWIRDIGFERIAILPGLGWRVIARRPADTTVAHRNAGRRTFEESSH